VSPNWIQRNESQRDIPQHAHKSNIFVNNNNKFSNDLRTRIQELKNDYHSHFVQSSDKKYLKTFCSYYCKLAHISIECKFRKGSNKTKVAWVPKTKE
jgi:hypothetical protein